MQESRRKFTITGISNQIRLFGLITEAHQILDEVIGPFGGGVKEEWSLGRDSQDRPLVSLNLSDEFEGRAEASLTSAELENRRHMRSRLIDVWGDLLQERCHIQLQKLLDTESSEGAANGG